VALIRAATTVLTRRTREESGNPELLTFCRELDKLRAENRELRREVERLKNVQVAEPTPTSPARPTRRAAALKRRRV